MGFHNIMSRSNSPQSKSPFLHCDATHWSEHSISRFPKEPHPCINISIFEHFSGTSVCFQILENKAAYFCFYNRLSSHISSVSLSEKLCHWLQWVQFFKLHVCKYPQKVYSFESPKYCVYVYRNIWDFAASFSRHITTYWLKMILSEFIGL